MVPARQRCQNSALHSKRRGHARVPHNLRAQGGSGSRHPAESRDGSGSGFSAFQQYFEKRAVLVLSGRKRPGARSDAGQSARALGDLLGRAQESSLPGQLLRVQDQPGDVPRPDGRDRGIRLSQGDPVIISGIQIRHRGPHCGWQPLIQDRPQGRRLRQVLQESRRQARGAEIRAKKGLPSARRSGRVP